MARKSRKSIAVSVAPQPVADPIWNAAAYVRLSSDDRKKRGDSLETQRHIIENFVSESAGIRIADVYSDNNATGTNFDRPGFQKMLLDAECGRINCIIVKDLTRFGRNAIDAGYYLEKYLPSLNVRFIAVTDDYDSLSGDGGIMLPLKNVIAESYALDISRKCKAVQRQNIADGRFVGRMAPFGYDKSPHDCHKLIIDPIASETVRQIYSWAADGAIPREIARRLNDCGALTPTMYKNKAGISVHANDAACVLWSERTVDTILFDRMYLGDMVQGKTQKINHKQIDVPQDKWVCVPNTHEPIISPELYDIVRQRLSDNSARDKATRSGAKPYTPNMFHGKVYCANCGRAMHRQRNNKTGEYWFRCESQWKYAKSICTVVSAREDDIREAVLSAFKAHNGEIIAFALRLQKEAPQTETKQAGDGAELAQIKAKLAQDMSFKQSLYENLVSDVISQDEYVTLKTDYESQIDELRGRAAAIEKERQEFEKQTRDGLNLFERLRRVTVRNDITEELIDALVEKISINRDKSVNVILKSSVLEVVA
jgi:DNA invertase Pin-like site-specific DNA recombinase